MGDWPRRRQEKQMNGRTLIALAAVGAGLLGLSFLQARSAGGAATVPAPATRTDPERSMGVAAEGRVVAYPDAEVKVAAERPGRLVRVAVQQGQKVRKGELLAEIDSDELRAALAEARARVAEADAEIRLAEANLKRRRQLAEERILPAHDLDQANRDLEIAGARRETARAEAERYEAQIRKTRVLSPIAGTVTLRHTETGQTVEAGDPVATVADLSRLRIEGEAHEADAGSVAVGAPVTITCDGYPGRTWRGRVEEVPDSVTLRRLKPQDPGRPTDTRILAVKVAFSEPSPLRLGATVELQIRAPR
jgi:RND family efflux transporter MFP subunit